MTKYYKPVNYSYDRSALLSVLNSAINETGSDQYSSQAINKNYFSAISDILGKDFKNFPLMGILFFNFGPGVSSTIHKDVQEGFIGGETLFAKMGLNLPLQNADTVHMKWYTSRENAQLEQTYTRSFAPSGIDNGDSNHIKPIPSPKLNRSDINRCIEKTYYTQPMIVSINNWHSVTNESAKETATFVSIRFNSNITLEMLTSKIWSLSNFNNK